MHFTSEKKLCQPGYIWGMLRLLKPCHIITQTNILSPLASQKIFSSARAIGWNSSDVLSHHFKARFKGDDYSFGEKPELKTKHRFIHTGDINRQKEEIFSLVRDARSNLATVQMSEMRNAPLPVFWIGVAGLGPYAAPVFLQMFTGYMPVLGLSQLVYSGTILSFLGGLKFGSMIQCEKGDCNWKNIGLATVPALWAWSALLLPTGLAFLAVGSGLIASLIIDLATSKYPPWFVSLKLFLTATSVLFLLLCLKQYLFSGRYYHNSIIAE